MTSKNIGCKEEIDAAINGLHPDLKLLLDAIKLSVSSGALKHEYKTDDNGNLIWGGRIFYDFTVSMPDKYGSTYRALLEENGINYDKTYAKTSTQGIGLDKTPKILFLSARAQGKDFIAHIKDFMRYCETADLAAPMLKDREETIRRLLNGEFDRAITQPKIPLQDQALIVQEVRRIKEVIGLYPYRKTQTDPFENFSVHSTLSDIEKLLQSAPTNIDLLQLKAWLLNTSNKREEALAIAEKIYAQSPEHSDVITTYASVLNSLDRTDEAVEILKQGKSVQPESPVILLKLGMYLSGLGQYDEAIEALKAAIQKDSEYIPAYLYLGQAYFHLKQYQKSESVLRRALKISPNDTKLVVALNQALYGMGRFEEGEDLILSQVNETALPDVHSNFMRAIREFKKGDFDTAISVITEYIAALDENPLSDEGDKAKALNNLANLFEVNYGKTRDKKHLTLAKEYYERALDLSENNETALFKVAFFCFIDGELETSKSCLEKLLTFDDYKELGFSAKDEIYASLSQSVQDYFPDADYRLPLLWYLEKEPESILILVGLARSYLNERDIKQANIYIDKALDVAGKLDPEKLSVMSTSVIMLLVNSLINNGEISPDHNGHQGGILTLLSIFSSKEAKKIESTIWRKALKLKCVLTLEEGIAEQDGAMIRSAIPDFELLLKDTLRHSDLESWRGVNVDLARAYLALWDLEQDIDDLKNTISYAKKAVEEFSKEEEYEGWFSLSNTIAEKLLQFGIAQEDVKPLEEASRTYNDILQSLEEENQVWLECQFQFARTLQEIGFLTSNPAKYLEAANLFKTVLEIDQRSGDIKDYSSSLYGAGLCLLQYCKLSEELDKDLLKESIACFSEIVQIQSVEDDPVQFATMYELYGDGLALLGKANGDQSLIARAVEAYKKSVKGYKSADCKDDVVRLTDMLCELN